MSVILLPPADDELDEAVAYYNDQLTGLGDQFYSAFLTAVNCISSRLSGLTSRSEKQLA